MSLVLAVFVLLAQLPIDTIANNIYGQLAAVMSRAEYGARLGVTVDEVVKSIRYQDKKNGEKSYITHRHIMALMCQENPWLNIRINNGQGFSRGNQEGLTQVIDRTARGLLRGSMARGRCTYVNKLENGACSDIRARVNNPRCSIELGACYYNEKLKQARGNPYYAFVGYNTGSIYRAYKANGLSSFIRGYNALASGKLCAKARANPQTWIGMYKKIAELTGGTFKTDDAQHIPISSMNWPKDPSKWPTPQNIAQSWWNTPAGQAVARGIGQGAQGYAQEQQRRDEEARRRAEQQKRDQQRARWLDSLLGKKTDAPNITPKATLTCNEVEGGVRLRWSCPRGTTFSRGIGTLGAEFETRGAGAGSVSSVPKDGTKYTIQCIKDQQIYAEASCTPPIITTTDEQENNAPELSSGLRDIIPKGVVMRIEYEQGNLIWATLGTSACILKAGNKQKEGARGILAIGIPSQNTLVTLACKTPVGKAVKYKQIIVK